VITLGGFFNAAFGWEDPVTGWLGSVDLGDAGLLLIALLLGVWAVVALQAMKARSQQGEGVGWARGRD